MCLQEFGLRGRGKKEQHRKRKQQAAPAASLGDSDSDGYSGADNGVANLSPGEKEVLEQLADYIRACRAPQAVACWDQKQLLCEVGRPVATHADMHVHACACADGRLNSKGPWRAVPTWNGRWKFQPPAVRSFWTMLD